MTSSFYMGMGIGVAFTIVCLLIAFTRRGSVRAHRIAGRVVELRVAAAPAEAFERLLSIAPPYRVDDSLAADRRIVLSSPPTFTTWGFFYPIEITAHPGGGSLLRIGIECKVLPFLWGPAETRAYRKCVNAIEAHLGIPNARVA